MWTATRKREAAARRPHAGGRGGGNSGWKAYHSGFACGGQVSESKGLRSDLSMHRFAYEYASDAGPLDSRLRGNDVMWMRRWIPAYAGMT